MFSLEYVFVFFLHAGTRIVKSLTTRFPHSGVLKHFVLICFVLLSHMMYVDVFWWPYVTKAGFNSDNVLFRFSIELH
eukprot:SAG31_NODE_2838_length_5017_cov_3.102074_8_plen_77_part_00